MTKTKSMARNQNHDDDDTSSRKRINTCDNGGVALGQWSDLNHDVLVLVMMQLKAVDLIAFSGVCKSWRSLALSSDPNRDALLLVMMRLGVVDFVAFSGVCKSWRSLALCNRKMFNASKLPMSMWISNEKECELMDSEGRIFKTALPHSVGRRCVGVTCGYLVLFGRETNDFWLVNPITSHQLHFHDAPFSVHRNLQRIKGVLVFSPSISGWVFIMIYKSTHNIWFCTAGKGAWNHVSTTYPIHDLHVFKREIYTINTGCCLYKMRLSPELKLTLLVNKSFWKPDFLSPEFVSLGENLYVTDDHFQDLYKVQELDVDEMEWVMPEKTIEKYAFFLSNLNDSFAFKLEPWERYAFFPGILEKYRFIYASMWYFPHECMNVNLIYE